MTYIPDQAPPEARKAIEDMIALLECENPPPYKECVAKWEETQAFLRTLGFEWKPFDPDEWPDIISDSVH